MKYYTQYTIVFVLILTVACMWGGCSSKRTLPEIAERVEVRLQVAQSGTGDPSTKTFIGGDRLDRVVWSERDTISVYWRTSGSGEALSAGQRFHCYLYTPSVSTFATKMEVMASGSYDYYAAFPKPASVEGTRISYQLPAEQDGTYDRQTGITSPYVGNLDFMVAEPLIGQPGLSSEHTMTMNFVHQCHVMRIQVPTGRNQWGASVRKLRVEFPSAVVGTMSLDVSDPHAAPTLSAGGNVVTAVLSEPLGESTEDDPEGQYVWLFLCPGTISGDVRFTAYDENGYQSQSLSVPFDKTLEKGRITPVNLTIPEELPVTWLDFSIAGNNLGETPNTFTVTVPEGAVLRNGTNTQTFTVNDQNLYSLGFYSEYDGIDNGAVIRNGAFTITYDSENAIVSEQRTVSAFTEGGRTPVSLTVPYLFMEDFSGVSAFNSNLDQGTGNPDAEWLDPYGLPGWSAARTAAEAGKALKISVRHEWVQYPGRVDSRPLSSIKSGKSVNVSVTFNAGKTSEEVRCRVGTTTDAGLHTGNTEPENGYEELILDAVSDLSYDNIPKEYTLQGNSFLLNCTNQTRLSWNVVRSGGSISFKTWYMYLDNIRVSIVP